MTQMFHSANPILPFDEYIPDPEVHVFGNRVYLYGSHDAFNGQSYCERDYVTWSASVNDLTDWTYEGVIYRKTDHHSPIKKGKSNMYAPDVAQGPDGHFYLYYSIADSSIISVAKSSSPTGPFSYYGEVKDATGKVFGADYADYFEFDPAVLVDGDRIFLYSGSGQKANEKNGHPVVGLFVRELEKDMLTAKTEPKILMQADDDRHKPNFFEAASIRKFDDWYYLMYMATDLSGLHYMMSRYPDRGFEHKGLLYATSQNTGNDGSSTQDAHLIENNHGSMEKIGNGYYVFNHRHTNRSHFSRQTVGDKLERNADGTFETATYTSQGLRGRPFDTYATYPAAMACQLNQRDNPAEAPFVTQEEDKETGKTYSLIKQIIDKSELHYKYFSLPDLKRMKLRVRGQAEGQLTITLDGNEKEEIKWKLFVDSNEWMTLDRPLMTQNDPFSMILSFEGEGSYDIESFELFNY
ncbi:hypothetical protein GCM10008932_09370 [Alkalibacterium iburiense]|uniref:Uncharacterized protein n=1 Tax=Alkalibacterium iburiense TaxID=290589 RepID=A0ABN0X9Q9_9LACT